MRNALERLGPFYVKVGQMLSTRPDLVPDYMVMEFEHLHQRVSVAPFSDLEPVLEDELGRGWRTYFRSIQTESPLGAASLAQVYQAELHSGQAAVVKVQRAGIVPLMLDDMALLRQGARILARRAPDFNEVIDLEAMLEVIFRAMEPELDFKVEARNMEEAGRSVTKFETLAIPHVVLATPRVLVQSLAPGVSIRDANKEHFTEEQRQAIGRDLLAFMLRGYFVDRMFHADPHPGNIFVAPGEPAHITDWGMIGRFDKTDEPDRSLRHAQLGPQRRHRPRQGLDRDGPGHIVCQHHRLPERPGQPRPDPFQRLHGNFNLGVSLSAILKFATRRGIQTPPVLGLLGKSFANIDGSVRALAPEISVIDVFQEELQDLLFDLFTTCSRRSKP